MVLQRLEVKANYTRETRHGILLDRQMQLVCDRNLERRKWKLGWLDMRIKARSTQS